MSNGANSAKSYIENQYEGDFISGETYLFYVYWDRNGIKGVNNGLSTFDRQQPAVTQRNRRVWNAVNESTKETTNLTYLKDELGIELPAE